MVSIILFLGTRKFIPPDHLIKVHVLKMTVSHTECCICSIHVLKEVLKEIIMNLGIKDWVSSEKKLVIDCYIVSTLLLYGSNSFLTKEVTIHMVSQVMADNLSLVKFSSDDRKV